MLSPRQLQETQKKNRTMQVVVVLLSFSFLQLLTNQTDYKILNQMCNFQFQHKPINPLLLRASSSTMRFFFCNCSFFFSHFFFFFLCVIYFFLLVFWVKKKNCILGEEEDLKKRQNGEWRKRKDIWWEWRKKQVDEKNVKEKKNNKGSEWDTCISCKEIY